mmetsp:Transcript_20646/g.57877  ORF Transcript_20646/g.57877 Transcript_20646/m.57877 type:complete len:224 (-) Transcript_20646:1690-2361(-)
MSAKIFGSSSTGPLSRLPRTPSHLCEAAFQCFPRYILVTPVDTFFPSNCSEKNPRSDVPASRSSSMMRCWTSGGTKPIRWTKPFWSTTASRSAAPLSRSTISRRSEGASTGHRSRLGRGLPAPVPPAAGARDALLPSAELFAGAAGSAASAAAAAGAPVAAAPACTMLGELSVFPLSSGAGHRTGCSPRCAAASVGFGMCHILWSPPIFSGTTSRLGRRHQKM